MWQLKHFTTLKFASGHPPGTQDSATYDSIEMGPVPGSYGPDQTHESRHSVVGGGLTEEVHNNPSTSTRHTTTESSIPFGDQGTALARA